VVGLRRPCVPAGTCSGLASGATLQCSVARCFAALQGLSSVKSIQSLTCGSSCWQLLSHSYDKSSCSTFSIAPVILDDLRTSRMVAYRSGPCLVLSRALACGHVMKSDIWALKYCSVCCVIVGDVHSTNILSHLQPMMGDIQDLHNVQISFQTMPSVGRARLQMMQTRSGALLSAIPGARWTSSDAWTRWCTFSGWQVAQDDQCDSSA
jgi:hypothetical protein